MFFTLVILTFDIGNHQFVSLFLCKSIIICIQLLTILVTNIIGFKLNQQIICCY